MAGKPGRSGGPRAGSGRPPKPPQAIHVNGEAPLDFLLSVMHDETVDGALRVRAAVAAAQYVHTKRGDGGIKDERNAAAKVAGSGKFAPASAPPRLVVNNK